MSTSPLLKLLKLKKKDDRLISFHKIVKILSPYQYFCLYTYSYIFVIYIIVNTTVTDIAPISNLIFPNSLLIDAESSVQLHSYFKKQKHLNSFMSLSKLNLLIKVVTFGFWPNLECNTSMIQVVQYKYTVLITLWYVTESFLWHMKQILKNWP